MEKILKKRISSWDGSTIEEIKFYYFKIFFSKGRVLRVLKTQREIFISETIVEYSEDWGGNLYARSNMFQAYDMIQFSSVTQLWLTLCDPMNRSTPGLPVHHQLQESTQTHVHWVSDAIQPSHPLLSPSLSAFNLSPNQGLFQWVSSLHQAAKILEFQL